MVALLLKFLLISTFCIISIDGMGRYIPPLNRLHNVERSNVETSTPIGEHPMLMMMTIKNRKITMAEFKKMLQTSLKLDTSLTLIR
jgi:hypothetical protein